MQRTLVRWIVPVAASVLLMSLASPTTAAPPTLAWIDHFGGSSSDWARGVSVTSDAAYVVGEGNPRGAVANNFVRRYRLDGRVDWTVGIEPPTGSPAYLHLIDVGAIEDGAYVLGSMRSARGNDVLVAKVASDGDVEWTARLGTTESDSASAISVTTSGIFVAGTTRGAFAGHTLQGGTDAFVARLDAEGGVVWTRQFGTGGADGANAIWAGDGAVYVAGPTSGELSADGHVGSVDAYVRKLDADGDEVWTRQLGTSAVDSAFALDVDGQDLAVAGTTDDAMPGARSLGSTDAFVTLLSSDGDRVWTHQFGGSDADTATAVAIDDEQISIGGSMAGEGSRGSSDAVVWTFATDGAQTDVLRFGTEARDQISDLDADAGDRYVAGLAPGAFDDETWEGEDAFVGRMRSRDPRSIRPSDEALLPGVDLIPRPATSGSPGGGLFDANPVPQPPVTGPEPTTTSTPAPTPSTPEPTPTETATPSPSPDKPGGGNGNGNGNGTGNGNGNGNGGGGDPTGPTGATGETGQVEDTAGALEEILTSDLLGGFVDVLL